MSTTIDPSKREAAAPSSSHDGPVTLINSFVVPAGREDAFFSLWQETSAFFRAQPGFLSLRAHRSLSPDAQYHFVNVANWASLDHFRAAHALDRFRELVSQPAWSEFPSSPALYEVVAQYGSTATDTPVGASRE